MAKRPKREWPAVYAEAEGTCPICHHPIAIGDRIRPSRRGWRHVARPGGRGYCGRGGEVTPG